MVDILSSDRTVPVVIVMIAGHLTSLRRCMANLLLSHTPCKDIRSMLLPPILFHLPTQVYSMQSLIVHNMVGPLLCQPKLSKDTVWVVCLYYAKIHKWHPCRPRIPPCNVEVRKVAEVCLIWLSHNLQ